MHFRSLSPWLLALFAWLLAAATPVASHAQATRALIVSIDGLRPDLIARADTPALRALMKTGSFTLTALSTELAITLPSHVSMLTGVPPAEHGVTWNGDRGPGTLRHPLVPTLFDRAHQAGFTTAMVAGKTKFAALEVPGTLDWSSVQKAGDRKVTDRAVRLIEAHAPRVLFVHLPGVDRAGHFLGWGSWHQRRAVAGADDCVGRLIAALEARGVADSTVVVVTSDHGGQGRSHGSSVPESRVIPWIVSGPGVRHDLDLGKRNVVVHTEDTYATVCRLLGIPTPPVTGRFVSEIGTR